MARIYIDPKADPYGTAARRKPQKDKPRKKEMKKCANRFSHELTERATGAELVFKTILDLAGIRYTFQKPILRGSHFYIADFFLDDYATIVEIDGGYHDTEEQEERDAKRTEDILKKTSIARVVRFSNEQVVTLPPHAILLMLAKALCPWVKDGFLLEGDGGLA